VRNLQGKKWKRNKHFAPNEVATGHLWTGRLWCCPEVGLPH